MSALFSVPARSVGWRAALVLLATLLAHAWLLARVDRMLSDAGADVPTAPVAVNARLLPPPPAPAVPQAAPAPPPRPRPAPVVRKATAPAPAPGVTTPPAEFPAAVDVGPDAFGAAPDARPAEPAAAADSSGPAEPPPAAEPATEREAAAQAEPFEATGASLRAALASLAEPRAALPATAHYVYATTNSELRLVSGTTAVDWSLGADGQYQLRLTTAAIGVTVLELESQGRLDAFGLAPARYTEKRIRRGVVAANFDWEGRRVTFSARPHERPLADGVQDRISFQFQLMLLGQAQPERFREGRQTVLQMAGRDDVSTYRFRSAGPATTLTGIGEVQTVKLERIAADETDARIEVWLAPSLGWLPARLRFTDRYGRVTESVLESMPTS